MGREERLNVGKEALPVGRGVALESVRLTRDYILVRFEHPKMTTGGILLPDGAERDPVGTVMAVGPRYGFHPQTGEKVEQAPQVGDRVVFDPSGARKIAVGGEYLLVLREPHIVAILGREQES